MQYDADTPQQYMELLDDDWRRDRILAIREMLLDLSGIEEGIAHKMLQYRRGGDVFAHLNAQKAYVGVYLGDLERVDPGAAIRGNMNCGKGCLRLRKKDDLGVIQALLEKKASRA